MKYVGNMPMVTFVGGSAEPEHRVEEKKEESLQDNLIQNSVDVENIASSDINQGANILEQPNENVLISEEKINEQPNEKNETLNKTDPLINYTNDLKKEVQQTESQKPILKKAEEKLTEITKWDDDKPVKLGVFNFINKSERTIFFILCLPFLIISIVSTVHVIDFFMLTNNIFWSTILAIAFESAAIGLLFSLAALSKIKKNTIFTIFFGVAILQILGNVYHSYITIDPYDNNLIKLLTILGLQNEDLPWSLRIIGFLQGAILPVISLSFVKSLLEFISIKKEKNANL